MTIAPDVTPDVFCEPRAGSAELALRRLDFDGERLERLAWKALNDGLKERRVTLLPEHLAEAHRHLVLVGVRAALIYDEELDKSRDRLPVDTRFAAFAYQRMRPRLLNWMRDQGRSRRRNGVPVGSVGDPHVHSSNDHRPNPGEHLEGFEEQAVSRLEVERFRRIAELDGETVERLTLRLLRDHCSRRELELRAGAGTIAGRSRAGG